MRLKLATITILLSAATMSAAQNQPLPIDRPHKGQITLASGQKITYKAYENIIYAGHPIDTIAQRMSIYEPDNAPKDAPVILKTYTTDFSSAAPQKPSADDETALALQNGFVVCIAGCRGYNSMAINTYETAQNSKKSKKKKNLTKETDVEYCGKLPAPLVDLKAAVRYLRAYDSLLPGNSEKIIATGYMAGGGLAALLGTTAGNPVYNQPLEQIGAADASDMIYGVACFAPLSNPLDAARSGEWLTDNKGEFPNYIKSLALIIPETETPLNAQTYRSFLKEIMSNSALEAMRQACVQIAEEMGPEYYSDSCDPDDISEYMVDFNLNTYLQKIKSAAYKNGFRQYFMTLASKTFGDKTAPGYALSVKQMDIFGNISEPNPAAAVHWYIRHGALDTSTPITESVNLATMLFNIGIEADFEVPWNVSGSQDYDISDWIEWVKGI